MNLKRKVYNMVRTCVKCLKCLTEKPLCISCFKEVIKNKQSKNREKFFCNFVW